MLPEIKAARPEFIELSSHALQQSLRREFLHQKTTGLIQTCAVIATEELQPANMSRSAKGTQEKPGRMVKQKAGLNREILSAGLGMAHQMLAYKAVEAGTRLHVSNSRQLKPSQRCSGCWACVPKTLAQRVHVCPQCGLTMQRDQNSALVVLINAHTPGTGVVARPKPLARQRARYLNWVGAKFFPVLSNKSEAKQLHELFGWTGNSVPGHGGSSQYLIFCN